MPKKLKTHANERVDLNDFVRASNDYTSESVSFGAKQTLLDRRSRVLDGFRIAIADQVANAGQITVYNGTALDRDGRILNNEDQANAAKTITLSGASLTFYVEIEFTETESDTDSRAFWDPTLDQVSPIPDGKEFSINATTRLSPDWRIVTPVSTTGFDAVTNANSNRIPLAVLVTDASNLIDATAPGAGFAQVFAATVLEGDLAIGATSCRVLDARLFPDTGTFNLDVGAAGVEGPFTITSVDRVNGVIVFAGGPTASSHLAGAIVRMASGTARFVPERVAGFESLTTPTQPDAAQRIHQADEIRGSALASSKELFGSRDDLQLRSMKDQVDFLAAQVRELKFGHMRPDDTSESPPDTFAASPRYFDRAGSVQGARVPTVSVGNGTTSYGDYNSSDETAFSAAVAFLATKGGGVLHLKAGTYTFANTVLITDPITIFGAGKEVTSIVSNVAAAAAIDLSTGSIDDDSKVIMEDFTVSVGTGSDSAVSIDTTALVANQMNFSCLLELQGGSGVQSRIMAYGCSFLSPVTSTGAIAGLSASSYEEELANSSFAQCTFYEATGVTPAFRCALANVIFTQCFFTNHSVLNANTGATVCRDISFYNCQGTLSEYVMFFGGTVANMVVENCTWTISAAGPGAASMVYYLGSIDSIVWKNNKIATTYSGTGVGTQGRIFRFGTNVETLELAGNQITVNSGQVVDTFAFEGTTGIFNTIRIIGNKVAVFHRAVRIVGGVSVTSNGFVVLDNYFDGGTQDIEQHGVLINGGSLKGVLISNNVFTNIKGTASSLKRGITLATSSSDGISGTVLDNHITVGGVGRAANLSAAIYCSAGVTTSYQDLRIVGNIIGDISGLSNTYGIFVDGGATTVDNELVISSNRLTGFIDTIGVAGSDVIGIHVEGVNNSIISNNTIAEVVTAALNANTASISIQNSSNSVISGNRVATPKNTGTPTGFEAGIVLRGSLSSVSVTGNVVNERTNSNCEHGIQLLGDANIANVNVRNNTVFMGATMRYGIFRDSAGVGTVIGLSVCGNTIDGLQIATLGYGINLSFINAPSASSIRANDNSVTELTWDAWHGGITINGNAGAGLEAQGVQCNCNVLRGDLTGAGTRSVVALSIGEAIVYQVNNNLIEWVDLGITGKSIETVSTEHGSIVGNVIRSSQGATSDIEDNGTHAIVGNNIVGSGSASIGTGVILVDATSLKGAVDDDATAITNMTA